jgi:hypothetical protein
VNEWFRAAGPQLPAYDRAMAEADPADRREGRTTIRVHDFVNRGAEFDPLYIHAPRNCTWTMLATLQAGRWLGSSS